MTILAEHVHLFGLGTGKNTLTCDPLWCDNCEGLKCITFQNSVAKLVVILRLQQVKCLEGGHKFYHLKSAFSSQSLVFVLLHVI